MMMCGFPLGAMVICLPSNCWPVTVGKTVPTAGSGPESGIFVKPVPETAIWPYSRFPLGTTVPPLGDAPPPEEPPVLPGFDGTNYWIRHECPSCSPNADLNHDGVVNGADLGILLGEFGLQHPHIGDLNFDGQVTGESHLLVLTHCLLVFLGGQPASQSVLLPAHA